MPQPRGCFQELQLSHNPLDRSLANGEIAIAKASLLIDHLNTRSAEPPREQERVRLEDEAGNFVGVREVMESIQLWRRADQFLAGYRSALRKAETAVTTDHANALRDQPEREPLGSGAGVARRDEFVGVAVEARAAPASSRRSDDADSATGLHHASLGP